jgi:hypothetical protein
LYYAWSSMHQSQLILNEPELLQNQLFLSEPELLQRFHIRQRARRCDTQLFQRVMHVLTHRLVFRVSTREALVEFPQIVEIRLEILCHRPDDVDAIFMLDCCLQYNTT